MKVSKIIVNIYTLIFLMVVFRGSERMTAFVYVSEYMVLMGALLVVGRLVSKREFKLAVDKGTVAIFFTIFLFIILDYFLWTIYPECTSVYVKRFLFYLPIVLISISINSIEKIINISKVYIVLIAVVFIILYPLKGVNGSFLGNYQYVAGALSLGLLIFIIDFLFKENYSNKDIFIFLFITGTLLMTGKRTFTVIPVGTMLFFTILKIGNVKVKIKIRRLIKIMIPAVILGGIILIVKPDMLLAVSRLLETNQDAGMNGRKNFWDLAMYLWYENKWTGIGMGTYQEFIARNMEFTYAAFRVQAAYAAHNIYYQLLAEVGISGTMLFIIYFVYNMVQIIRLVRIKEVKEDVRLIKYAYLSMLIQIWFLLYGCTGNPLFMVHQFYIYLFAVMIYQAIKRKIRYGEM